MARADLLVELVAAARRGDTEFFERTVHALAAEERANQHQVLADRLEHALRLNGEPSPSLDRPPPQEGLFHVRTPRKSLSDLVMPDSVLRVCGELVEEQHRAEILRSHGLEPRHRVLLVGPPGNGKTSLAEALAEALVVPVVALRYDAVIGSYLGETARQLAVVFSYVRSTRCVFFIDEFDAIAKERGDTHETGEIKRVVSSLLLLIDAAPSYVVVVAASNHPELLDRASWRRFQVQLLLPAPGSQAIVQWLRAFERRHSIALGRSLAAIANQLQGASFGEVEDFAATVLRRTLLEGPEPNVGRIVARVLGDFRRRPRRST